MADTLFPRSADGAGARPPGPLPDAGQRPHQARALATREAIVDAATVEFAEAGYRAASLSRIVDRSGVTKGALYFHFTSKKDLADAVVEHMERANHRMTAEAEAATPDPLRRATVIARLLQDMLDGPPVLYAGRRLCAEGLGGPHRRGEPWFHWQEVFGGLFARAAEAGLLRGGIDPGSTGRLVTDIQVGAFTTSLATTDLADHTDRICHHWELVLGAVATERWLAGWRADGGMARVLATDVPEVPGVPDVPDPAPGGG